MKVSYKWLKEYFKNDLGSVNNLADVIGLKAFQVDDLIQNGDDYLLDLDVLPNRAHDAMCHYGVAREIATVTDFELNKINFEKLAQEADQNVIDSNLKIEIVGEDGKKFCKKYIGCVIENVLLTESPKELREKLESIGEKSINNVVDITNLVMFTLGQPMHAFDKDKLDGDTIFVRPANMGEELVTLDNKHVVLEPKHFVIADQKDALAIAGVKGGKKAEVDLQTKNIVLESANFDSVMVRKTSRNLNIMTESSKRYEHEISPYLAEVGMNYAISLIKKYASGSDTKIYKKVLWQFRPDKKYQTGVSPEKINSLLGTDYSLDKIEGAIKKLDFEYQIIDNPRNKIVEIANSLIGTPHKIGASLTIDAPNNFDCSSMTAYCYMLAGLSLPRITVDQLFFGDEISKDEALPGDLVFGNSTEGEIYYETKEFVPGTKFEEGVDHVGIYLGDDKVLHSSRYNKTGVEITDLNTSNFKKVVGFRKYFNDNEKRFAITVPHERLDLRQEADLVEEIGRVLGYENIHDQSIDVKDFNPAMNPEFYLAQKIREVLLGENFSEIITYSFVKIGQVGPANPIAEDKKYLRDTLENNFKESLEKNILNIDWLMLDQIRIFEIGKIHTSDSEILVLGLGIKNRAGLKKPKTQETFVEVIQKLEQAIGVSFNQEIKDGQEFVQINLTNLLSQIKLDVYPKLDLNQDPKYKTLSQYPFVLRDLAVWIPNSEKSEKLIEIIKNNSDELLIRPPRLFDVYEKDGRTSYAYRLVLQSYNKTLTDEEANAVMDKIYAEIRKLDGWEIR